MIKAIEIRINLNKAELYSGWFAMGSAEYSFTEHWGQGPHASQIRGNSHGWGTMTPQVFSEVRN